MVKDDTADPYVRHSVAPDPSIGMLSKQPWEQSLLEQHEMTTMDAASEPLSEHVHK
jgi:hypothetical protein